MNMNDTSRFDNLPFKEKYKRDYWIWTSYQIIALRELVKLRELVRSYLGKSWQECERKVRQSLTNRGYAKFANNKMYDKFLVSLFVHKTKNGQIIDKHGFDLLRSSGNLYVYDDIIYESESEYSKKKQKENNKKISSERVQEFNGFIKNNLWFKKINGFWYVADIKIQQYVRINTVYSEYDGAGGFKREPGIKIGLLYNHTYGRAGNCVYYDYTYQDCRGYQGQMKISHSPSHKEKNAIMQSINDSKKEGIKEACFYSYLNFYFCSPKVKATGSKDLSSANIAGNPVAVNKRLCSKKLLKKYKLSNDNSERRYDNTN